MMLPTVKMLLKAKISSVFCAWGRQHHRSQSTFNCCLLFSLTPTCSLLWLTDHFPMDVLSNIQSYASLQLHYSITWHFHMDMSPSLDPLAVQQQRIPNNIRVMLWTEILYPFKFIAKTSPQWGQFGDRPLKIIQVKWGLKDWAPNW